ncbi:MAG: hypothetical protein LJE70_00490 [Chromatiaceae bacterium]|nr:hypothetical protein [Chromatiaceae bacterium]
MTFVTKRHFARKVYLDGDARFRRKVLSLRDTSHFLDDTTDIEYWSL